MTSPSAGTPSRHEIVPIDDLIAHHRRELAVSEGVLEHAAGTAHVRAAEARRRLAIIRSTIRILEWLRDNREAVAASARDVRAVNADQTVQALRDAMPGASIRAIEEVDDD